MKIKIKNLKFYGDGEKETFYNRMTGERAFDHITRGGWTWTIIDKNGIKMYFYTNKDGEGLWLNDKQIQGTCQYHSCKTYSGQYKKIKRQWENKFMED